MKIVSFQSENFKRIKAVRIDPTGAVVELTGANRQGKSSILDAIWAAMGGKDHIENMPIHKGESEASIMLDLGDLKVKRTFKDKGEGAYTTSLTVTNADGSKPQEPQKLLNSLLGRMSLDPVAFERAKPAEQYDILRRFVTDFDFAANTAARKKDYEARTDANRRADAARVEADAIVVPTIDPDMPTEAEIAAQIDGASAHNSDIERRRANRAAAQASVAANKALAERLDAEAEEHERIATEKRVQATAALDAAEADEARLASAKPLPEPIIVTDLVAQLATAREASTAVEIRARKDALTAKAEKHEAESKALTDAIHQHDQDRNDAITNAKMPVEGLGFGDECVTLRGVPFEQASDEERLTTSMAIGAAMNPKLRVMSVSDASRFDRKAWATMAAFAEANDFQIWAESVESGRAGALVIEDGTVAGVVEGSAVSIDKTRGPEAATKPAPAEKPASPFDVFKSTIAGAPDEDAIEAAIATLKASTWMTGATPKEKALANSLVDKRRTALAPAPDDL